MSSHEIFPPTATWRGLAFGDVTLLFGTGKRSPLNEGQEGASSLLSDQEFQLVGHQAIRLARTLEAMTEEERHEFTWDVGDVERRAWARLVEFELNGDDAVEADSLGGPIEALKLRVGLALATGYTTQLAMQLWRDAQGRCYMRIRGDAAALALGYNAYTAATADKGSTAERAMILRLPIEVMGRLLASVDDGEITWPATVASNVGAASYRPTCIELFTYVPIESAKKLFFLSSLRVLLSCPVRCDDGCLALLSDLLGVKIGANVVDGQVHQLTLHDRRGDGQLLRVSISDPERVVRRDAAAAGVILPEAALAFLSRHLRISVTLNEAAMAAHLVKAASGNSTKRTVTAAALNAGIAVLNTEVRRGAARHLLRHLFETIVPLSDLARYRPVQVDLAANGLKAGAAAGYEEWSARGFAMTNPECSRVSFLRFLQVHANSPVSEQVARTARSKVRAAGINPDIPLAAYNAFFAHRHLLGLDPAEMAELVDAVQSGKGNAAIKAMEASEDKMEAELLNLKTIIERFIEEARVPAVLLTAT